MGRLSRPGAIDIWIGDEAIWRVRHADDAPALRAVPPTLRDGGVADPLESNARTADERLGRFARAALWRDDSMRTGWSAPTSAARDPPRREYEVAGAAAEFDANG
jgi:hypothetical protein